MFTQLPSPAIFAHRGASAHAPENTLAAFELAIRQQADGIELDAKLCADGNIVVIHDRTIDRTTARSGRVSEMSLPELRELDAGSHFDVAFKGEPIPTLDEVFETLGRRILINVELANYASPLDSLPERVAALVNRYGLIYNVLFSSFNPIALRRIHHLLPKAPLGILSFPGPKGALARSWLGKLVVPYHSLHPHQKDVSANLVERTHHSGRRLFAFGVNQAEEMQQLFKLKVDGIFTDDPLLARRVLATSQRVY